MHQKAEVALLANVSLPLGAARTGAHSRTVFFGALITVTALPMLLLPLHDLPIPAQIDRLVFPIWIVLGYSHVMATLWFGLDPDYRPIIAANRVRMIGSLMIIPVVLFGLAFASVTLSSWIFAAYSVWLAHHYNRQNFGLVAFAGVNDNLGPVPREVGWMFHLTTGAGAISMAAMPTLYPGGTSPFAAPVYAHYGQMAAIALMISAFVVLVRLLLRSPQLRRSPLTLIFLGLGFVFYLPALLGGSSEVSFWPYTIAHGLQYLLMIAVVSRGSKMGLAGIALFAMIVILLGSIARYANALPAAQLYTGIVMWHFLADSRLWRLRDPLVRGVIRDRFSFLFDRQGARRANALT